MKRIHALALGCAALLAADGLAAPPAGTAGRETDPRLPPVKGSWSLRTAEVKDASLPRVLVIGDSIASCFLDPVRKALDGKANIDAWITPVTQADKTLPATLAAILAQQRYAVIHFNLGLHGWQAGRIPEGQYEPLTHKLVQALKTNAPQAKLIWATITPVTAKGEPGKLNAEIQPVIEAHNAMALKVMKDEGVEVNDLSSLMLQHLDLAAGDMFHWTGPGRDLLAKQVTETLLRALPAK